ncbi:type II toxin-antitoxin system PemK/MazF family toxin [Bacteroides zhangwenhongii]|uniref:Type II toxin-antitoxin system PemK/MazF family toxin n=1 Tax=Bacteroides zhangwenhongii TaxID=2650157 RepID=A0ABT5H7S0_9BACE|nr:type II toxin-antitoxin system PemK/MazF family toxin [Bacteroides zhangwenhongii]MDC7136507.1 type II toxin-antitoxin system PemK/MazF family toxin [Bacteroides zhangwenhongii]
MAGKNGEIAADQLRAIDKSRIKRKIGELNNREIEELKEVFRQMFCE